MLCPFEGENGDHEVENEDVKIHSIFNPDLQWKRKVLVLRMKFESPKQLKICYLIMLWQMDTTNYITILVHILLLFASSIQQQQQQQT